MWMVSLSDPGVVSKWEDTASETAHMRTLSLNEEELKAFLGSDPIF